MTPFQCIPIDATVAAQFRTGQDARGNAIRRMVAADGRGFPCRHCLHYAADGEEVLLGSYDLSRPQGVYWTPSPIFMHAEPCGPFVAHSEVAPIVRLNGLVSVRAYDAADQCLYDLGEVCTGAEVDAPLQRALTDQRTSFVNIHTARPGCFLCRVERLA